MTTFTNLDPSTYPLNRGLDITALFLGCQVDRDLWVPVRKLIWRDSIYRMGNVAGVQQAIDSSRLWQNFFGLSQIDRIFVSHSIPPDFSCRMPLDRPHEMQLNCPHLGLTADLIDPIVYVARSGGYRDKDRLDVFPEVNCDRDGKYRFFFGLENLNRDDPSLFATIQSGDTLLGRGLEGIHSPTGQPLGIVPGYIRALLNEHPGNVSLQVERVNKEAFITKQKLLCSATCSGFVPFTSARYQPIGNLYGDI